MKIKIKSMEIRSRTSIVLVLNACRLFPAFFKQQTYRIHSLPFYYFLWGKGDYFYVIVVFIYYLGIQNNVGSLRLLTCLTTITTPELLFEWSLVKLPNENAY